MYNVEICTCNLLIYVLFQSVPISVNPPPLSKQPVVNKPMAAITPLSSTTLTSPPPSKSSTVLSRQATVPPINFNMTSSSVLLLIDYDIYVCVTINRL